MFIINIFFSIIEEKPFINNVDKDAQQRLLPDAEVAAC